MILHHTDCGIRRLADYLEQLAEYFEVPVADLLRIAAHGLLPADLLRRRRSSYPGAAGQAYERAVDAQLHGLLAQSDAPLFDLISRERLTAAHAADPRLPGLMSVQPSSTSAVAYLLDVNRWLEQSGVTIR